MSASALRKVAKTLLHAHSSLGCRFLWRETEEGREYWHAQYVHLRALAKQLEAQANRLEHYHD